MDLAHLRAYLMEDRVKARVPAEAAAVVGLGVPLDEIDQGAGTLLARKHKLRKTKFFSC